VTAPAAPLLLLRQALVLLLTQQHLPAVDVHLMQYA
jgi:hypothetical protein